jgi:four helix bundle protein
VKDFRFDFENLKVYQKTLDLVDQIFQLLRDLPKEYRFAIGDNLLRAALSISNNIAEGNDKGSVKEQHRYFRTSSGSARECISVLIVLKRQGLVKDKLYQKLRSDVREITSMLRALMR